MADERKPVICRCGKEMVLLEAEGIMPAYRYIAQYHCGCGWNSPVRDGVTREEAIEAAYAAATCIPPNRPLTREQVEALDDLDAVWFVRKGTGKICVGPAREAVAILISLEGYSRFWFFASLPTPADIEAARKEETNESPA